METNGKYELIYRAGESHPDDVRKVRAGDVVTFYDNGFRTVEVEKVTGKFAKKVKVKAVMYGGTVLRRGKVLQLDEIKEVLRPRGSASESS